MRKLSGIGINNLTESYHIDHLAPICMIMDIPLLFLEDNEFQFGKKFYPELKIIKAEYDQLTPEYLIENYDVMFVSEFWDKNKFFQIYGNLEKKYKKKLRRVFCPHGFSDKVFYFKNCAYEDIVLIYGQNMLDLLKEQDVLQTINSYTVVGNYRYSYYKQQHEFYTKIAEKEVWSKFKKVQPTIIYAPTWLDQEHSTSFFQTTEILLDTLPSEFNMLVKLHPRLELDDIVECYRITGKYEDKGNILFLKDFPPIYPLLEKSDIYLGDASSIGYDFLTFNRPMFFLNKHKKDSLSNRSAYLFRCGIDVKPDQYKNLYKIISDHLANDKKRFSQIREQVYQYTFGEEKPFSQLRKLITDLY
jgi:teichoic acid glycerol-phosphate primase